MEDFGYSKQQEESATGSLIKRAFLVGATLFSLACFAYVTMNAYYFFSQDGNNGNIPTIKAEANPIKITENKISDDGNNGMRIDDSIYEDIFGNRKHKEKEVKIKESASPALPPKPQSVSVEADKKIVKDNTQFVTTNQNQAQNKNKSGQIIVYSDAVPNNAKRVFAESDKARQPLQAAASAVSNDATKAVAKLQNPPPNKKYIRVQIAALTSKNSADEYWDKLQRLYPGLFSGLKSIVEQVDLGKRGIFYRLQIGNFFDQVRAEEFCNRYVGQTQKSKADCIVVE